MIRVFACSIIGAIMMVTSVCAGEPDKLTTRAALEDYLDKLALTMLEARQDQIGKISTVAQADARKAEVRSRLIDLIGEPVHGVPLRAKVTRRIEGDGFHLENVLYDAQPGRRVTANLYLPASGEGPFPAVILSPGHGPGGKISLYGFAVNLARNGFAALAYDIVGEGERLEYFDVATGASRGERPTGDHSIAAFPAILAGEHVARYFIEDAMQGVDYLVSRPEVDAERIGAFGCSGGGTVTAYLVALDERVQAAATACYVTDFGHLLTAVGPQEAEQSIHNFIANGLDIPDWIELAVPKPYAVISTTEDMFPYAGAAAAVSEARSFWAVYGAAEKLEWISGPGGHGAIAPLGDEILDFFRRSLAPDAIAVPFVSMRVERPEDLLVTPSGQLMTSMGSVTLAELARERVAAIKPSVPLIPELLRTAIRKLAHVHAFPGGVPNVEFVSTAVEDNLKFSTFRLVSDKGPLEFHKIQSDNPTNSRVLMVLSVDPVTCLTMVCTPLADLARDGQIVVALQARGMDGDGQAKSEFVGNQNLLALRAMLVGQTLPGIRIDDTIAVMDWIDSEVRGASVTLMGIGVMGPVVLQAALLDQRIDGVIIEGSPVSLRIAAALPIARELPANTIPDMLAHYDLPDVISALKPRQVVVIAPVDSLGNPLGKAAFNALVPNASHLTYETQKSH